MVLISSNGVLDLEAYFPDAVRQLFEIGFGMGESLATQAKI